jgi:hypothetical protein
VATSGSVGSGGGGAGGSTPPAGSSDAGVDDAAPFPIALHPAWPQLVAQGGGVLTAPAVLTVTFTGDTLAPELASFGAQATDNAYWDTVRAGYCAAGGSCVGRGAGTSVALGTSPAATYTDSTAGGSASTIQDLIETLIESQSLPALGGQTIPVFYFPSTTSISFNGQTSCDGFGGYHNAMRSQSTGLTFTYAVVVECAPPTGLTLLQEATLAASHEIIESATDPVASSTVRGFYLNVDDPAYLPWNAIRGGEAADLCIDTLDVGQDRATESGFTVQRIWSNAAAAAGGDPCVPARATPYFNVAVESWLSTQAVGSTSSFEAVAFSNAPVTGGWTLVGVDLNADSASGSPYLTISIGGAESAQVNNGDPVAVSVTLNQDPGALTRAAGGAVGVLVSFTGPSLQAATAGAIWPFLVQTPADGADSGLLEVDASEDLRLRSTITPVGLSHAQLRRLGEIIHGR